jgi:hypothetical protein
MRAVEIGLEGVRGKEPCLTMGVAIAVLINLISRDIYFVFIKMFHETSKSTALSDIKRTVVKRGASNCNLSVKLLLLFCKQSYEHAQRQRVLSRTFLHFHTYEVI